MSEDKEPYESRNPMGVSGLLCACGGQLKPQDKFCSGCGKFLSRGRVSDSEIRATITMLDRGRAEWFGSNRRLTMYYTLTMETLRWVMGEQPQSPLKAIDGAIENAKREQEDR